MRNIVAALAILSACAPRPAATSEALRTPVRYPVGIFTGLGREKLVTDYASYTCSGAGCCTNLDCYIQLRYTELLENPALSGVGLGANWSTLSPRRPTSSDPNDPAYDWSYFDDVFAAVEAWNSVPANPLKTVRLGVFPGFNSPDWLYAPSDFVVQVYPTLSNCTPNAFADSDPPWDVGTIENPDTCGYFQTHAWEGQPSNPVVNMPVPWNATYKAAWAMFVEALAKRYGSRTELVSVEVTGPTAQTGEMILPNGACDDTVWNTIIPAQFPHKSATWQSSDQVFIDEWENAIDLFGANFPGITLGVTTSSRGFPNLTNPTTIPIPSMFAAQCASNPVMDCASQTTILAYLADPNTAQQSGKAVSNDELLAQPWLQDYFLTNAAIGQITELTQAAYAAARPSTTVGLIGGDMFMSTVSPSHSVQGCQANLPPAPGPICGVSCIPTAQVPAACLNQAGNLAAIAAGETPLFPLKATTFGAIDADKLISPEQQLYNILQTFFNGTRVAGSYGPVDGTLPYDFTADGGYAAGTAPLNYLSIYDGDITYGASQCSDINDLTTCTQVPILDFNGDLITTSFQALLETANQQIHQIAVPATTAQLGTPIIPPGQPM